MLRFALLCSALLAGCVFENQNGGPPEDLCPVGTSYQIDTGATLSYTPGVDAGYYVVYGAGGQWHFEWTCDTRLSADGCNFTGSITAPTPAGGTNAECFQCEPEDSLTTTQVGAQTRLDFDTITTSGIDGVDFFATAGSIIHVDLQINGIYQNDLVFLPSGGAAATPQCMPTDLVPSTP